MRVVVVGQGYVGLPLAIRAAEVGHEVIGYDVDSRRVKTLAAGESFVEDVTSERIRAALDSGAYRPSESAKDCGGFDVAVVTVPTPLHEGTPDLRYIRESAITLARYLRPGATVILESTTYPGTTQEMFAPILEDGSGLTAGTDFQLGYSPERIDPGNTVWGFKETPKVVSGVNEASLKAVQDFYDELVDTTVPVGSPKEAELAKLLENTFRHVNIALVNEIAMFAHHLDIDVWQSIDAASTKPFGFMRFTPGPGVGGHCLPIDPSYLSWRVKRSLGRSFRFVELANDVNDHMPEYVVRRLVLALNGRQKALNGSRILLLGLSYKRNSGDARESPAMVVADRLLALGAEVRACDPHVPTEQIDKRITLVEPTEAELSEADAVILLTDHDAFPYGLIEQRAAYALDTRNRLRGAAVDKL
ncbi:MAG: UDP-N-acetyl-D-glucosamine dehydrogenase [Actinomycetota bacterium]|nr:UDP-N-acetyl-D-glucosamine dehydrogenase [Actinomycetota bacterium]